MTEDEFRKGGLKQAYVGGITDDQVAEINRRAREAARRQTRPDDLPTYSAAEVGNIRAQVYAEGIEAGKAMARGEATFDRAKAILDKVDAPTETLMWPAFGLGGCIGFLLGLML